MIPKNTPKVLQTALPLRGEECLSVPASPLGSSVCSAAEGGAGPGDYFALLKPRVMSLAVFTALTGMVVAPGFWHPVLAFASLVAISLGAGAAGALNMWYEADIDRCMSRTRNRPIPSGKILPAQAYAFGCFLTVLSVMTLGLASNWLAAALLFFTIFFYVIIYTVILKPRTPQNIVIGGAAGALPPVVGYVAASGQLDLYCFLLFAIIFIWTPPHFWALGLLLTEDYKAARLPMLPNVKGTARTALEILLYTGGLIPVALLPWWLGLAGLFYGLSALMGGGLMLYYAWRLYLVRERRIQDLRGAALGLFKVSILYLFLIFSVLLIEHILIMD